LALIKLHQRGTEEKEALAKARDCGAVSGAIANRRGCTDQCWRTEARADTRPDLTKPVIYWTPVIAPGNLMFYKGAMFPQWQGSALIGGMASQTLNRITFDGKGGATPAERWAVGHQVRDVEVGPDGALWILENANPGGLFRVTPK
jgi:glucose/arabinose dehydrogenase